VLRMARQRCRNPEFRLPPQTYQAVKRFITTQFRQFDARR